MANAMIIDALFCIPKKANVMQLSDCVPFNQDLAPLMNAGGIAGAVLAHCNCWQCQHHWNCADRRTHELVNAVRKNPRQLRGLASYDPLRIGESLRWIDEALTAGGLSGAYADAECCIDGLDGPRMYALYGLCARLGSPMVLGFHSPARWVRHLPQVEVVAADFPELNILLAAPAGAESASILGLMRGFPRISFLLCPENIDAVLCECIELQGRERAMFRSSSQGWPAAVKRALQLTLSPAARRAYIFENASRVYGFQVGTADNVAGDVSQVKS